MLHFRIRQLARLGAGLVLLGAAFTLLSPLREAVRRAALFGGPVLEVIAPDSGGVVAQGGIPVLLVFPRPGAIRSQSLRCLLNGEDVTARLTQGSNGASGTLWSRAPGPQLLRVEILGRAWWGEAFYEDRIDVRFRVRPNPSIDLA